MKKSLVALAALAVVGAASAQSTVTLYGVVDANINVDKSANSLVSVGSSGLNGSRFGMRGTEDLGGGLAAIFQIEAGFNTDTGASAQAGAAAALGRPGLSAPLQFNTAASGARLFGRTAIVGLSGGFGRVTLGRTYTPIGWLTDETATMGTKPADTYATANMLGNAVYRTDNALTYASPNFGGLTFAAQYSLNADGAEVAARTGRHFGFNVIYKGGPIQAGIGYIDLRTNTVGGSGNIAVPATATTAAIAAAAPTVLAGADAKGLLLNLGYDFGVARLKGVLERDRIDGLAEDRTFMGLEASVPFGAFTASLGVARLKDATGRAGVADNVNLYTLQGVYNMSKRTALYSFLTHVDNAAGSNIGFNAPAVGQNSQRFQVGVRHSF